MIKDIITKTSEIKYLKDLNPHGSLDPHNIFPLFLNILASKLAKFRIPKGSFPSQFSLDYRPQ